MMRGTTRSTSVEFSIFRYSIEENEYLEVEPETGAVLIKKTFPPNLELRLRVTVRHKRG